MKEGTGITYQIKIVKRPLEFSEPRCKVFGSITNTGVLRFHRRTKSLDPKSVRYYSNTNVSIVQWQNAGF